MSAPTRTRRIWRDQAALVEELDWLVSFRMSPDAIARQLQTTPGALRSAAARQGREDLAAHFPRHH